MTRFHHARLSAAFDEAAVPCPAGLFEALADAHDEPSRHYHDRRHIDECLTLLDRFRHLATRPAEVEIALWFHDAVYDSRRDDNEALSAEWAEGVLAEAGGDEGLVRRVGDMIRATRTHVAQGPDGGLMQDIDLAILGAEPARFDEYDRAIRQEYAWVPEDRYRERRRVVLGTFLERETIYVVPALARAFDAPARENLARAVSALR